MTIGTNVSNLLEGLKNLIHLRKESTPKSTHRCEVVPVVLEKHNNADSLSIVKIGGYQVVVRTEDWLGVDRGAYIQPDSVVPDRPEYGFLGRAIKDSSGVAIGYEDLRERDRRITAKKFRGERSEGLLVRAPKGASIGDNVAGPMGITRYVSKADSLEAEEAAQFSGGWWHRINRKGRQGLTFAGNERGPSIWIPVYDLENWYRYPDMFTGEDYVTITEKVHGCNARFVYSLLDQRMFAGSRQTWKRPFTVIPYRQLWRNLACKLGLLKPVRIEAQDDWNRTLRANPQIETWCKANPDHVLFGEIYGDVQDLKYGCKPGEVKFVAFDVFYRGAYWPWLDVHNSVGMAGVPLVPVLYEGKFSELIARQHVDGKTTLGSDPKQMREGVVVREYNEVIECTLRGYPGRRILKAVSSTYLERSSKDEEQPIVKRIMEKDNASTSL